MIPTNGKEALQLIKLDIDRRLGEKRLALAEQRFAETCRRRLQQHELAQARLRACEERERRHWQEIERRRETKRRRKDAKENQLREKRWAAQALADLALQARAARDDAAREWAAASELGKLRWSRSIQASGSPSGAGEKGERTQTENLPCLLADESAYSGSARTNDWAQLGSDSGGVPFAEIFAGSTD